MTGRATAVTLPPVVAVLVVRGGRLPVGADEAVAAAGGTVIVTGSGTTEATALPATATRVLRAEIAQPFGPARLAAWLAPVLTEVSLVVLPASPDGRDLAPRLAAELGRPLLAAAERVALGPGAGPTTGRDRSEPVVTAALARLDDRVLVDATVDGPAVATLLPHRRDTPTAAGRVRSETLDLGEGPRTYGRPLPDPAAASDPEVEAVLEPDLATLDLADARVVVAGGAGLAAGLDDAEARTAFERLGRVANALGGAAGATRVATDAGWTGYERQIGTTGVAVDPDLYVALGISGAAQHVGGLGTPRHVVSVNLDASCPMTAMADLGLVADAGALLDELARRLGVAAGTNEVVGADDPVAEMTR
ncbi:MAG: mycofactocin-associated electron transfer flavoprotein alpha subunit [Acidimicrobiales bacterium]|nr:mycofactocin-associated electron transfer flavoprotein alpha subunit [Acidimicrobiales bacterium]